MAVERETGRPYESSGKKDTGNAIRPLHGSDATRLSTALQELLTQGATIHFSLHGVDGKFESQSTYAKRITVRQPGGVILFLPVEQIDWIEASDQYVRLHAGEKRYLMRESIAHLEARLDPAQFRRIHRSTIVNLDRIRELHVESQTQRWVALVNGDRLQISKAYWAEIQKALASLG